MKTYAEKLRDPRWQKKRLEIMERDSFRCRWCASKDDTLHVHHKTYEKGHQPWEYEDENFLTLCETCHELAETEKNRLLLRLNHKCLFRDIHTMLDLQQGGASQIAQAAEYLLQFVDSRNDFMSRVGLNDASSADHHLEDMKSNAMSIFIHVTRSITAAEGMLDRMGTPEAGSSDPSLSSAPINSQPESDPDEV